MALLTIWLGLIASALVIGFAGYRLVLYGHIIADRTNLGATLVGVVMISTITSLPELATGISAVTIANAPDLAVGDALGSCVFNLLILLVLEILHPKESLYARASQGHILAAGLGVALIGIAALGLMTKEALAPFAIGHVGITTPLLVVSYVAALRLIYQHERRTAQRLTEQHNPGAATMGLADAIRRYFINAAFVVVAGSALPFLGDRLAVAMNWNDSFVGTVVIALSTSLPEIAVTISAARLKALDLAVANLMGSNLFDIAVLAVDDIFYTDGPLLAAASVVHANTAVAATAMTGIVIAALLYRPTFRPFRRLGWTGALLLALYILNSYFIFHYGD